MLIVNLFGLRSAKKPVWEGVVVNKYSKERRKYRRTSDGSDPYTNYTEYTTVAVSYTHLDVYKRQDLEWYDMIVKLYRQHGDNPKRFQAALEGLMYNFSARFFQLDYETQSNICLLYTSRCV